MKIPVFDIDWTLLAKNEPKVHHMAFLHAFKELYGYDIDDNSFREGSIDNQIILESLTEQGIQKEDVMNNLGKARNIMIAYFEKHKHETIFEPMPGVVGLLKKLEELAIPRGLLTGNIEEIGWAKVEAAGIKKYFQFGAFGSMAMTRPELVSIAAEKASIVLHKIVVPNDIVVIGDTPLDVASGKKGGAYTIAVATCPRYSYEDLQETVADVVVRNMTEQDKILEFLKD